MYTLKYYLQIYLKIILASLDYFSLCSILLIISRLFLTSLDSLEI